jgi:MYXO-CTERM domain-containing protein
MDQQHQAEPRRCAQLCASRLTAGMLTAAAGLATLLVIHQAQAQTWQGGRENPSLGELVALDATGESGWPFGQEDVAEDGLDQFQQQEQSIDIRSVYATTSVDQFWVRLYVSDDSAPGGNVTAFIFIDADADATTGGTAASAVLDDRFTTDSSPGGYDYVVAVGGNESVVDVWEWSAADDDYASVPAAVNQASAEVGTAIDPLLSRDTIHGYLQLMVALDVVGLTPACDALLYARSVNDTGALGDGDLEVGQVGPCVPADADSDRIPDLLLPSGECQTDADCPGGGICVDGECLLAPPCVEDADCEVDEICVDGLCVARGGDSCDTDADCNGLVCVDGECVSCSTAGVACPDGMVCGPDGRCVADSGANASPPLGAAGGDGIALGPGEQIEGGAGNCAVSRAGDKWLAAVGLLGLLALAMRRRRRR